MPIYENRVPSEVAFTQRCPSLQTHAFLATQWPHSRLFSSALSAKPTSEDCIGKATFSGVPPKHQTVLAPHFVLMKLGALLDISHCESSHEANEFHLPLLYSVTNPDCVVFCLCSCCFLLNECWTVRG
jgi:hypothetical protein